MKKILFLITLSELGGAQKYVAELASYLKKNKYNVVVASKSGGFLEKELAKNEIKFIPIKNITRNINFKKDIKAIFEIRKIIKKEKPEIVHLNSSKMGILGAIATKISFEGVKKIVFTAHGWVFNEDLTKFKKIFYILISKLSAFFCDKIICVSKFDFESAIKHKIAPKKKLALIHNGINEKEILFFKKETAKKMLGLKKNEVVVGTIANLYKTKNLQSLVFTANLLKNKNILFVIIGDGPERKNLENLILKLNLKNFLLLGKIQNAANLLKAFDIFVISSKKEGFPYALLEAGLAEVPILATRVGGILEFNNNELIFIRHNPKDIAKKIELLLNNKNLKDTIVKNMKERILKDFTTEKMIEKTIKLYN